MPNRILRDWTASDRIDKLSAEAERFFTRLIMKADDFGFYYGSAKMLSSSLYPLKDVSSSDIILWLNECVSAEVVMKYSVDGKEYVHIFGFDQRLRTMKSKFPPPIVSAPPSFDGQLSDIRPLETKRNEVETKANGRTYNPSDYYSDGQTAFDDIKQDELLIERLVRIVQQAGFKGCDAVKVTLAVRKFITVESAKEEFSIKPKAEVKKHLVNWINKNAKNIEEYAGVSR